MNQVDTSCRLRDTLVQVALQQVGAWPGDPGAQPTSPARWHRYDVHFEVHGRVVVGGEARSRRQHGDVDTVGIEAVKQADCTPGRRVALRVRRLVQRDQDLHDGSTHAKSSGTRASRSVAKLSAN